MCKVAVIGASGYTGAELLRILVVHPRIEICAVTSRQHQGVPIAEVFPSLRGFCDLVCEPLEVGFIADRADIVLTALPHKSAMDVVPGFLDRGCRVIDLSADYRLRRQAHYEQWYQAHTSPELLDQAVYGLPERYRDLLPGARLVANPGCYPTSVILALAPLLELGLVDSARLIIDSKSGASGAGRSLKQGSLFCEIHDAFKAYGVGAHRHTPEIEQELGVVAGCPLQVSFTPHLIPVARGILSTCYADLNGQQSTAELLETYRRIYAKEPFVRILPEGQLPDISMVRGTNLCDIGVVTDQRTGRVIVVSAIDNLVKGAAGQAVQNLNLLAGFPEDQGLQLVPAFP